MIQETRGEFRAFCGGGAFIVNQYQRRLERFRPPTYGHTSYLESHVGH